MRTPHYATLAAFLVVVAATSTGFAAARTQTDATTVGLVAADDGVEAGETTTYDVVVEGADGAVGAYQFTLVLADSDVGAIADARTSGDPRISDVTITANGSEATVAAVGATVEGDDPSVIASVTVSARTVGTSALNLSVDALGDPNGASYEVTATSGANLTVEADETGGSSSNGGGWNDADSSPDGSQSTGDADVPADDSERADPTKTTAESAAVDATTAEASVTADSPMTTPPIEGPAVESATVDETTVTSDRTTGGASRVPGFGGGAVLVALAAALAVLGRLQ
ncbi:hypothetical protein [Halorussus marinus]|uniref:hypothetical protein n=1 Tax=Halorussus marinus TaxID=2505976 RepID=UPI00106DFCEE|nr:hypothetical protein [Halorussus marinus]